MPIDYPHAPVLASDVLRILEPKKRKNILDGTLGLGGHAEMMLQASGNLHLYGIDRDSEALDYARRRLDPFSDRVRISLGSYENPFDAFDRPPLFDGVLLDLGVNSIHLDRPERGFSFGADGPLDMRFDRDNSPSAADLVNSADSNELYKIIREYGEERFAGRVANAIVARREIKKIETTADLAAIVSKAVGGRPGKKGINPATRTFQALRIAVNEELKRLAEMMVNLPEMICVGARVCVISFHSLEDRIVKNAFRDWAKKCICPPELPMCRCSGKPRAIDLTRKPIQATNQEIELNPRSRSAKMRAIEWCGDGVG